MASVSRFRNALMMSVALAGLGVSNNGAASSTDAGFDVNFAVTPVMPAAFTPSFTGLATRVDRDGTWKFRPHNLVPNSACQGVTIPQTVSVAGALPGTSSSWAIGSLASGCFIDVVGQGVDPVTGFRYTDFRCYGNPIASGTAWGIDALVSSSTTALAVPGETIGYTHYLGLVSGSIAGLSGTQVSIIERDAAHAFLSGTNTSAPVGTAAALVKSVGTRTIASATCTHVSTRLQFNVPAAGSYDFTIRAAGANVQKLLGGTTQAPAPHIETTGSTAVYGPRWDYDPATVDAAVPHNVLTYSSPLNGGGWFSGGGATVAAPPAGLVTPAGGTPAFVTLDGTANSVRARTLTIGTEVKPNTSYIYAAWFYKLSGLVTGTKAWQSFGGGRASGSDTGLGSLPTGQWTQIVATFVTGASGVVTIQLRGDDVAQYYLGDAQLNEGTVLTPFVPTANNTAVPPSYTSKALRIEPLASTNIVRNSTMQGAVAGVVGSGGAFPTNWVTSAGANVGVVTYTISTPTTEQGLPVMDVRCQFTATAADRFIIRTDASMTATAATVYSASGFLKQQAGTFANVQCSLEIVTSNATPTVVDDFQQVAVAVPSGPISACRLKWENKTSGAGVVTAEHRYSVSVTAAGTYDLTIRIGPPQFEALPAASYPIPTYGAAVTRPSDWLDLAVANIPGFTTAGGYAAMEWVEDGSGATLSSRTLGTDSAGPQAFLYSDGSGTIAIRDTVGATTSGITYASQAGKTVKSVSAWDATGPAICVNTGSGPGAVVKTANAFTLAGITKVTVGGSPFHGADARVGINLRRLRFGTTRPMNDLAIQALVA